MAASGVAIESAEVARKVLALRASKTASAKCKAR
jgi:hypothetical protein